MVRIDQPQNSANDAIPFAQRPIVILGAGIIGCAAGHQLLLQGYKVILVAEYLPGDTSIFYASNWAGASWHFKDNISDQDKWIITRTHRHLLKLAKDGPESGVCSVQAEEYLEQLPGKDSGAIWGRKVASNVSYSCSSLQQALMVATVSRSTSRGVSVKLRPRLVLRLSRSRSAETHALSSAKDNHAGSSFVRRKVSSLTELHHISPMSSILINASGWGSRHLLDVLDAKCFPNRGQNVFYKTSETGKAYFRNGKEYTYVIPRPLSGSVILGGSKQPNETYREPDMDIAKDEITRAHRLVPHLISVDPPSSSLDYIAGIRPGREGGFRLEAEELESMLVLHAYGADSGGFSLSYGVADALVTMIQEAERHHVIGK